VVAARESAATIRNATQPPFELPRPATPVAEQSEERGAISVARALVRIIESSSVTATKPTAPCFGSADAFSAESPRTGLLILRACSD